MSKRKVNSAKRIPNFYRAILTHASLKLSDTNIITREKLVDTICDVTRLKKSSHHSIGNVITEMARGDLVKFTARGNFKVMQATYPNELATEILSV